MPKGSHLFDYFRHLYSICVSRSSPENAGHALQRPTPLPNLKDRWRGDPIGAPVGLVNHRKAATFMRAAWRARQACGRTRTCGNRNPLSCAGVRSPGRATLT